MHRKSQTKLLRLERDGYSNIVKLFKGWFQEENDIDRKVYRVGRTFFQPVFGGVAQLVEQEFERLCVAGSIPVPHHRSSILLVRCGRVLLDVKMNNRLRR